MAKLLGVYIDSNLSWHTHVEAIVSKATQRLYFLKQLKRAEVPRAQLLHFYRPISVVRPVLEYAVPVWHHLLTKTQTDSIESVHHHHHFICSNNVKTNTLETVQWYSL